MVHSQGHHYSSIGHHDPAILLCDSGILRQKNARSIDFATAFIELRFIFYLSHKVYMTTKPAHIFYMHTCEAEHFLGRTFDNF